MAKTRQKIHFMVSKEMKESVDEIAKEYNTTISTIMRTLIADVLDDEIVDDTEFRPYKRRREAGR